MKIKQIESSSLTFWQILNPPKWFSINEIIDLADQISAFLFQYGYTPTQRNKYRFGPVCIFYRMKVELIMSIGEEVNLEIGL